MDVLATTVARALGTSRRAAEIALWGPMNLARRCARVIAALRAAGADEVLVRFIQPIDLAIHAAQPPEVRAATVALGAPGGHMTDEMLDLKTGARVCARCGAYGDHLPCRAGRVGDRERILWFCARCLDPHHDTPGLSGG